MATDAQIAGAHGRTYQAGGMVAYSSTDAITAHAGGGQASAVQLTTQINNVTVCATAADSVKLPTPGTTAAFPDGPQSNLGIKVWVINSGAATLAVFPDTGGTINAGSANASVNVAPGEVAVFLQTSALTWFANTSAAGLFTSLVLNGSSSGATTVQASAAASGTLTLPAATDTLVGKATTDTLTNKTLTAPNIGAAVATSVNKVAITAPASSATLTIADGKTLTANNILTLAGTDSTTITFQGTDTYVGRATTDTLTNKTLTNAQLTAGTASLAPLVTASGTNLTSAIAGASEYDGVAFYDTSVASSRQVRDTEQFVCLTANGPTDNNTLLDTNTAAAVFRTPTNGTITLANATSYFFEAIYKLSNTGTTSHTWATLFAGAATLTSISYTAMAYTGTTSGVTLTTLSAAQIAVATQVPVTAASTSATEFVTVILKGVVRVNAGGTFIPQMQASARPGATGTPAVIILAGSYFRVWPVGSNTVASVGNWS